MIMAGTDSLETQIISLNEHLKSINANPNSVRVLENVGDYSYIIKFPQFNEYDVTLTLQVPADKSLQNSNVILNLSKKYDTDEMTNKYIVENNIMNILKSSNNGLQDFYTKTMELIEETFKKTNKSSPKQSNKLKTQKIKKEQKSEDESDENTNTKKCPMKTSGDVVHRIQWDSEINKEFIIVGYLDRFLGIKECTFNTFDWGDIVLADIGALAIPQHRINYFKYKNEVIWDKNKRIDNVYGSTGSNITIYDVIKRLENVKYDEPNLDEDEEVSKVGRPSKPQEPNYFISIPIDSQEIKANIQNLTNDMIDFRPDIEDILLPLTSLHITLCTLRIDSDEDLKKVTNILETFYLDSYEPLKMVFKNLDNFFDKVLYVKSDCDLDRLRSLRNRILDVLKQAKINLAGNYYDFVPHLTVAKISQKNKTSDILSIKGVVDEYLFEKYENFKFGEQIIRELHLCKMINIFRCKTYPVECTIQLNNDF